MAPHSSKSILILFCSLYLLFWPVQTAYNGSLCGYIDADFDGKTDLILRNSSTVYILLGEIQDSKLSAKESFVVPPSPRQASIQLPKEVKGADVRNCASGDVNGDNYPDLVLLTKDRAFVCFGQPAADHPAVVGYLNCSLTTQKPELKFDKNAQPSLIDMNGDGRAELLFPIGLAGGNGKPKCLAANDSSSTVNNNNESTSYDLIETDCLPTESRQLIPDFMHTFGSISSDTMDPNLILGIQDSDEQTNLEVWSRSPVGDWQGDPKVISPRPHQSNNKLFNPESDKNSGYLVLIDVRGKGKSDLIMPFTTDSYSELILNIGFQREDGISNKSFNVRRIELMDPEGGQWKIFRETPMGSSEKSKSFHLRTADYNLDGYPDMMIILVQNEGKKTEERGLFFVENVPCVPADENLMCMVGSDRTFRIVWDQRIQLPAPASGNKLEKAWFFDLDEDGSVDIGVEYRTEADGTEERAIDFISSADKGDYNFLKVHVYTPLCSTNCRKQQSSDILEGSVIPDIGAVIRYSSQVEFGEVSGVATLMCQTTHGAAPLPYVIFGLGQTPNFIDHLTVSVRSRQPPKGPSRRQENSWDMVIPNSRMYIVPYGPANDWIARLYVTPSRLIVLSFAALSATCGVIVIIILILYMRERREDDRDKQRQRELYYMPTM